MKGKKTGGRKEGTPNKINKLTRELINELAENMIEDVKKDLKNLKPKDRVMVFMKLAEFNIPKPQSIAIDINKSSKKTIEDQLLAMSREEPEDTEEE